MLHYADGRRGQRRSMQLVQDGGLRQLDAFLLAGDTTAEAWVCPLPQRQLDATA